MSKTRRLSVTELSDDERARIARRAKRLQITPTEVLKLERIEAAEYNAGVVSCRLSKEVKARYVERAREQGISVAEAVRQTLELGPFETGAGAPGGA